MLPKVQLGNLTLECGDVPTLEIKLEGKSYFLTPFRKYRFQVSETREGDWDAGSSSIVFYDKTIPTQPRHITSRYLHDAARAALFDFCVGRECLVPDIFANTNIYWEFIDECHKWIFGTESDYIINDDDRVLNKS